jgi:hypothetical protein
MNEITRGTQQFLEFHRLQNCFHIKFGEQSPAAKK